MTFAAMILVGVLIDIAIGWPRALFDRLGHPVTWLGALITRAEARLNRGSRGAQLRGGVGIVALCVLAALVPAVLLGALLPEGWVGILLGGVLAWPLIATRSMHDHVADVARPLAQGDLDGARGAVSMIVGRDPAQLDAHGIARAAIESLAENTSDGIIAPVFWGVVAGLPGLAVYKAINTMDSMIGHKSTRYEAFGKCAAWLDDVVNWPPARLTGALFALASGTRAVSALAVMRRDARAHRSPNAGWPEGAMAGALDIRLSGPRAYDSHTVDEPWLNAGARDPSAQDLNRALSLFRRSIALMGLALVALALV